MLEREGSAHAVEVAASAPPARASSPPPCDHALLVEVVEAPPDGAPRRHYRDAVRFGDGSALLVVADAIDDAPLDPRITARCRALVREPQARALGPSEVLDQLNGHHLALGLRATAACARLDAREHLLSVACAGGSRPWVVRGRQRVVRVQAPPTVELGSLRDASFRPRALQFDEADALLLPSAVWADALEALLAADVSIEGRPSDWLRAQPARPKEGCVLCLTLS